MCKPQFDYLCILGYVCSTISMFQIHIFIRSHLHNLHRLNYFIFKHSNGSKTEDYGLNEILNMSTISYENQIDTVQIKIKITKMIQYRESQLRAKQTEKKKREKRTKKKKGKEATKVHI